MKKILPTTYPLIAAATAVALSLGSGSGLFSESRAASDPAAPSTTNAAQRALVVEVITPRQQTWERSLTVSGGLYAWQEAIVASELGGVAIQQLNVDVGSVVQRGQVLARLSQETVRAALAAQQASVARARAALTEATANAERAQRLKDSGALSEQQIQQLQLAAEAARAGLAAAEAAQHAEEVRLRQTLILAIDHGVISSRTATLGAVVQPGSELFRLVRQGRIEWRAELTAEQLGSVRIGQKARVRLSDGRSVEGKVRMISPTLDVTQRKALAYIDLTTGHGARAGMFGQGEIDLGQSNALTLPNSAIVLRDGNTYVFEVMPNQQVEQRKLQIGRHLGNDVEILAGLDAKARIVVRGGAFLNPHDRVQITSTPAPATPATHKTAAP